MVRMAVGSAYVMAGLALLARGLPTAGPVPLMAEVGGTPAAGEPAFEAAATLPDGVRQAFPQSAPAPVVKGIPDVPVPVVLPTDLELRDGDGLVLLGAVTVDEIHAADRAHAALHGHVRPGPERVGLVRAVAGGIAPGGGSPVLRRPLAEDRTAWLFAVRSPGARGLRLHFTEVDLRGGAMIVYARDGDPTVVHGPYTARGPRASGDFWTESLPGDTAFVEIAGREEPEFRVTEIVHFERRPDLGSDVGRLHELGCHLDVMCYGDPPVSIQARQATGLINFVSGDPPQSYVCSGTLLNDLDHDTSMPYFLTAYHCLHTQDEVDTMEVTWLWQRASCGGSLPTSPPSTVGGTLLETNPSSGGNDMAFIRLTDNLPGGLAFAGWKTSNPDDAYGIHHPDGSWKRATFYSDAGTCLGCAGCGDPTDYEFYDFDDGIIEGGSSGSGIFNSDGQLTGQLYGHCCPSLFCAGEDLDCGNSDEFTAMYGEFATTFPIIRRWLEIGGTIHVDGDYSGTEEGTPDRPFDTVTEANEFAWDGSRIMIQAGEYPESLTVDKEITMLADGGIVTIGD